MTNLKPFIVVVAAALLNEQNQVLYTQRPKGKPMAGLWEFPGGKIEPGETSEQALKRELYEELDIHVNTNDLTPLTFASQVYDEFIMLMPLYTCRKWTGLIFPKEEQRYEWVSISNLKKYPMPPADETLLDHIIQFLLYSRKNT